MLNKLIMTALVVCTLMVPGLAHSWSLTTRINNASGQLQVNAYPVQTSGSVIRTISSGTAVNIVIAPAPGFSISKVQQGSTYLSVTPAGQTVTIPSTNTTAQTINVWFGPKMVSVTAAGGVGGTVVPTGTLSLQQGSATSYVFTPAAGNNVLSISGIPAGATVTPPLPGPLNTAVTVAFTVPDTAVTMNGVFLGAIANAGAPQTVLLGSTATLDGSGSTGASSYAWTQTNGPATVTLSSATAQKPTFTAAVAGSYQFKLVVNGTSTSFTTVIVSASAIAAAQTQCQDCHQPLGVGVAAGVFDKWSASPHSRHSPPVMCYSCHVGANTGGHPGPLLSTMGNICLNCHAGDVATHPFEIGSNTCISCHNPHSTVGGTPSSSAAHYNNITSAGYPASYVTSRARCEDCHYGSTVNAANRLAWAQSGHGLTTDTPWRGYDFKTMAGCVQCHTTTGFIAYSTGKVNKAWGVASDKTKEVLSCIGCHSDVATGAMRTATPVRPYTDDSYVNKDVGMSNICMDCHTGTKNGSSVARLATFAVVTSQLVQPHYLAAGGILHGRVGYQPSGRSYGVYTTNTAHRNIGIGNTKGTGTNGPCVACHKTSTSGHTFKATATTLCAYCHGSSLDATKLAADKAAFATALDVLKAELASKGYPCSAVYPYISNKNWGAGQAGADTMGAAFNYILLANEPGAYAHNSAYARQMLLDAIDYLDDGKIDGTVNFETILQGLVDSGRITSNQATAFIAYKNSSVCTSCHNGPANTGAPMATAAHPAHLTGAYGPAGYLGNDLAACQACHPYPAGHADGTIEVLNGAGSSCAGCHPGSLPAWTGGRVTCASCHGTPPSVLPNGVTAPVKPNFATTGHGMFGASSQCTNCHDGNGAHISGSVGVTTRLLAGLTGSLNAGCSYCHNDPAKVSVRYRNMSTHVTAKGGGQAMVCATCHDPHGTTNLSMIRTTINGQTISYSDRSAGLVNATTNQGLCQVCHTQTAHYRAGIAESSHPTTNCLSCHSHNAAGAAFKPNGSCDACHGYPPAPKSALSAISFGTMNNWSSARFEDYSGGGGAHLVAQHVSPTAKPSEGWANCAVCHNGGVIDAASYHVMTLPLANHVSNVHMEVDPKVRFAAGFAIYTGAKQLNPPARNVTGSCFNISCHMSPSPRWSIER